MSIGMNSILEEEAMAVHLQKKDRRKKMNMALAGSDL